MISFKDIRGHVTCPRKDSVLYDVRKFKDLCHLIIKPYVVVTCKSNDFYVNIQHHI